MKDALKTAIKPAVRTLAQALAGGLSSLGVASMTDFAYVGELAIVLIWGAIITAAVSFCQNFAEALDAPEA